MKKLFFISIVSVLFLFQNKLQAQVALLPYAQVGYGFWFSKSKDITSFLNSYNAVQGTSLSSGFKDKTGLLTGFKGALGVRLKFNKGYLDMALTGSQLKAKQNSATFKSGDRRILDLYCNDYGFDFGFGWGNRATFGFVFNMCVQNAYVRTGFEYANGTVSYGNSHNLNGVYHGNRLGLFSGINVQVPVLSFASIGVDLGWYGTMLPADKFTYSDLAEHKAVISYLPRDYGVTLSDPYTTENDAVNDLKGLRFDINLRFHLPYNE
jgi:hypothetical protein